MKDKLSSRKGFTLTEMLMAVLLLALMTLVIGGGVTVVKNAYEKITLRAEADTLLSTAISAVKGELRTANIQIQKMPEGAEGAGGTVDILGVMSFENKDRAYEAKFVNGDNGHGINEICIIPIATSSPVSLPLLTDKTHTNKLGTKIEIRCPKASLEETDTGVIHINPDDFCLIIKITISAPGKGNFKSREVEIRPVNLS